MKVKILNKSGFPLPHYATAFSAGVDLQAAIPQSIILKPLERAVIPTGVFLEIPEGYEGQVRPRSGLAAKKGVTVLNAPGTVDSDYRGEVGVILVNLSREPFVVEPGDRIAQMVFARHERVEWEEAAELSDSGRGAGGFGSTGAK